MEEEKAKLTLMYTDPENNTTVTYTGEAADMWEVMYHLGNFVRASGYTYIEAMEAYSSGGGIYRSE